MKEEEFNKYENLLKEIPGISVIDYSNVITIYIEDKKFVNRDIIILLIKKFIPGFVEKFYSILKFKVMGKAVAC